MSRLHISPIRYIIDRLLPWYISEHCPHDGHVLEVGCGSGYITQFFRHVKSYDGIDINKKPSWKHFSSSKNKFHVQDATRLEFGNEKFDFILVFYVAHEVENKKGFFSEIKTLMKKNTKILIVEPLFHVSKNAFEETLSIAEDVGLKIVKRPKVNLSRAAFLK